MQPSKGLHNQVVKIVVQVSGGRRAGVLTNELRHTTLMSYVTSPTLELRHIPHWATPQIKIINLRVDAQYVLYMIAATKLTLTTMTKDNDGNIERWH